MIDGTGVSSSVITLTRMRVVLARAEQVIDDVEALLALRTVDAADIDEVDEGEPRIVAQERHERRRSCRRATVHRQLAVGDLPVAIASPRVGRDVFAELFQRLVQASGPSPLSARSCRCGGSSSAEAGRRRAAPRPSAGSPERRCRPARCGRSRAPPNRNSGSSRRHWRRSPSR